MNARAITLFWVVLAAGCGGGVGTGGQRLPPAAPRTVDFGAVVERTTKRLEIEVTNPLAEPVEVRPLAADPPFRGELFVAATLPPGGRLAIPVVFAPEAPGAATGRLEVRTPWGLLAALDVAGRGVDDLGLRCDERLEFGPEPVDGAAVTGSFRCESLSAGETRIRVGEPDGDERDSFELLLEDRGEPRSLPAGGAVEVPVAFRPRAYGGTAFAWVELYREDEARRGRVLLYGTTAHRCFFATPGEVEFACLPPGGAESRRLLLRNGCAGPVAVLHLGIAGAAGFSTGPERVPFWVPAPADGIPGEAAIDVTFAPPDGAVPDPRATLEVLLDLAVQPRLEVPLSGCVSEG